MTNPAIDVRGLSYRHPDRTPALSGVDLTVKAGSRMALLGENGAGKTTLALHLNGILTADAGTIAIDGFVVGADGLDEVRRRVGMVFADAEAQLFMSTVAEDVAFGPANAGYEPDEIDRRVKTALEAVDASALRDRNPHHLSTGEKRRVALATVLSMDPSVLVLDEPSAGLDPRGRRGLINLLRSLEPTQLVITHDLILAGEVCDQTAIMADGVIVAVGPTAELLADDELLETNGLERPSHF